jgi:hypothetical protein
MAAPAQTPETEHNGLTAPKKWHKNKHETYSS